MVQLCDAKLSGAEGASGKHFRLGSGGTVREPRGSVARVRCGSSADESARSAGSSASGLGVGDGVRGVVGDATAGEARTRGDEESDRIRTARSACPVAGGGAQHAGPGRRVACLEGGARGFGQARLERNRRVKRRWETSEGQWPRRAWYQIVPVLQAAVPRMRKKIM
jgi:hypothetical protein